MKIKKIKRVPLEESEAKIEVCNLAVRILDLSDDIENFGFIRKILSLISQQDKTAIEEIRDEIEDKSTNNYIY